MNNLRLWRKYRQALMVVLSGLLCLSVNAAPDETLEDTGVTLTLRDVEISEAVEMLSRVGQVNVLLSDGVSSKVTVNLYNATIEDAIHSIAHAGGYAVEYLRGSYFIVDRSEAGKHENGGLTQLRTFKVQYSPPEEVESILENHLSSYGSITTLPERRLLVVEDTPEFLNRIGSLLKALDQRPKLILIEAKILQIGLKDAESYGLDWSKLFDSDGGAGSFGVQGLSDGGGGSGLFFELLTPNVEVFLDMLRSRERLKTLSTPKLLTLEDQEAETIIGERLGYNVTTTVDNVTTTSVEFLESGVILRVKPSVDRNNRVLLEVHPEVSTGTVSDDGVPNQTTTEVTTSMLVESGKTVLIGGLIRRNASQTREGVPVLNRVPGLGRLFSNKSISSVNSELVVLITPYIIGETDHDFDAEAAELVEKTREELERYPEKVEAILGEEQFFDEQF